MAGENNFVGEIQEQNHDDSMESAETFNQQDHHDHEEKNTNIIKVTFFSRSKKEN